LAAMANTVAFNEASGLFDRCRYSSRVDVGTLVLFKARPNCGAHTGNQMTAITDTGRLIRWHYLRYAVVALGVTHMKWTKLRNQ
jgi:hypothetical protein